MKFGPRWFRETGRLPRILSVVMTFAVVSFLQSAFAADYSWTPGAVGISGGVSTMSGDNQLTTTAGINGISISSDYSAAFGFAPQTYAVDIGTAKMTMAVSPDGGGTTDPTGTTGVLVNQAQAITATVNEGYKFSYWGIEGDATVADTNLSSTTATLTGDATLTAYFIPVSVGIISPEGGEQWNVGSTHKILWSSENVTSNVKLELYDGDALYNVIVASTPDDEEYEWTIPAFVAPGSSYKIKLTSLEDEGVTDTSNAFTVVESTVGTLVLTAPDGGEKWTIGSAVDITWAADYYTGLVSLSLYNDGAFSTLISSSTVNDGAYSWSIPSWLEPGTLYAVKISSVDATGVFDRSDGFFSLVETAPPDATIDVTNPDGGERYAPGDDIAITWTSEDVNGDVKIDLYQGASLNSSISASTANDGAFTWSSPSDLATGGDYRIRIAALEDDATSGFSDAYFTFSSIATASLAVLASPTTGGTVSPSGTTTIDVGVAQTISATAAVDLIFVQWVTDGNALVADPNASSTTVTLTGDATVTALFTTKTTIHKAKIKIDNAKEGRDSVIVNKARFTPPSGFSFDMNSDVVMVKIDERVFELSRSSGTYTQKGTKNVYNYKSDSGSIPILKLTLDLVQGYWTFKATKASNLDRTINNADGVDAVLSIEKTTGETLCFGRHMEMIEKTNWTFNSSKNDSTKSSGTDYEVDRFNGKINTTNEDRDSFGVSKGTISRSVEFDPENDGVTLSLDHWWEKTLSGFETLSTKSYSWDGEFGVTRVKFKMNLDNGTWNVNVKKGDLSGVSAFDGLRVTLSIDDYVGDVTLYPTIKTNLQYNGL